MAMSSQEVVDMKCTLLYDLCYYKSSLFQHLEGNCADVTTTNLRGKLVKNYWITSLTGTATTAITIVVVSVVVVVEQTGFVIKFDII